MQKTCAQCGTDFEVTDDDLAFYERVSPVFCGKKESIPSPTRCSACRMQQRFTFRNFFNLYNRKSDLSGKDMISMYDEDIPFPVYEVNEWWGDGWNELDYGMDIDFSKNIFPQLKTLQSTVPRMGIANIQCENCEYSNLAFQSRNCYLVFGCVLNEDCCYGHIVWQSKQCLDCLYTYRSELCYQCVDCVGCFNLMHSQSCEDCSDSSYLLNCAGCKNCFGCVGLKQKEYHIFNRPVPKDEYKTQVQQELENPLIIEQQMRSLKKREVVKHYHGKSCENVTGDYMYFCKNTYDSFDAKNCEDSRYCATVDDFKDCHDCNYSPPQAELSYNSITLTGFHILFCHRCMNSSDLLYCDDCQTCQNCFGCMGLKKKKYCIFNKQYSQEEYEQIVPKIIAHMRTTSEWGEFPPIAPFAYNETMAQEYFPLSEKDATAKGYRWKEMCDEIPEVEKIIPADKLPTSIDDIPDDVLNWAIKCEITKRPFRIVKQELDFYRKMKLSIPHLHPDERHKQRMALRNPRKLWKRPCGKCSKDIQTTYDPDRPEQVYCESCYLSAVY